MEQIIRHHYATQNVGRTERAASVIAGSLLIYEGLRRKSWAGSLLAILGYTGIRHGVTGFCYTYQALGIRTSKSDSAQGKIPYELGVRIDEAVTINRPRAEVFRFWRDLTNLPKFLDHIDSIRASDGGKKSHWIAKGPGGRPVEWDAEIINETENELLAWRSLEGSSVASAGSVHFKDAAGGRGTEVRVALQYNPPFGAVGALAARLMGDQPSTQIHNDLKRLKAVLEAGVISGTNGQPNGSQHQVEEREKKSEKASQASEQSFPASDAPALTQ